MEMIASVVYEMLRDKISHLILGKSIDFERINRLGKFHGFSKKDSRVNVDATCVAGGFVQTKHMPERTKPPAPLLHSRLTREIRMFFYAGGLGRPCLKFGSHKW